MKTLVIYCALITLLLSHNIANAVLPAVGWKVLEAFAVDAATDSIAAYFAPDTTPQQLSELRQQLTQVKQQLAAAQQANEYPSAEALAQLKQLVNQSDNILNAMNSRMNFLEARVNLLETDIASIHQFLKQQPTDNAVMQQAAQTVEQTIQQASLQFDISYGYRPQNEGDMLPLTDNAILHSGDSYKITFTPQQDSYVYIFQVDGSEKIARLFPMEKMGNVVVNNFNPVKANQTYHIPGPTQSFKLDQTTGTEKIYFIASQQQDVQLEQWNAEQPVMVTTRTLQHAIKTRGPAGIVNDPQQNNHHIMTTEDGSQFNLDRQYFMGRCQQNGCVNVLSFEHR